MSTAVNIKRKNIDLPIDALQKLSIMAVAQGKSLKSYIESILISNVEGQIEVQGVEPDLLQQFAVEAIVDGDVFESEE